MWLYTVCVVVRDVSPCWPWALLFGWTYFCLWWPSLGHSYGPWLLPLPIHPASGSFHLGSHIIFLQAENLSDRVGCHCIHNLVQDLVGEMLKWHPRLALPNTGVCHNHLPKCYTSHTFWARSSKTSPSGVRNGSQFLAGAPLRDKFLRGLTCLILNCLVRNTRKPPSYILIRNFLLTNVFALCIVFEPPVSILLIYVYKTQHVRVCEWRAKVKRAHSYFILSGKSSQDSCQQT